MFPKKYFLVTLLLAAFAVNAQTAFKSDFASNQFTATYLGVSNFSEFALDSETAFTHVYRSEDTIDTNLMRVDFEAETLAEDLNALYFKRRSGMEKTGRILTFIGVPLAIIGGIMVAGADELYYNCVNGDCEGDARGGFGVVALAAGLGLSGTGTVLWIMGSKR
ncbi:hypothetical protein FK220_012135 [Flavobacteriaceae bacterium TP-CH-4]|uniref:Uncharacterized protein n=1 Tax=Pelagihabitans pacificus TaxID=2696054 RepID=A0A967AUC3_9FLAO|nr:hypothetical protein [Pelagihabitans pacificus]NHF60097.1 hypothetical protein [Pelagihabitans pacificus]